MLKTRETLLWGGVWSFQESRERLSCLCLCITASKGMMPGAWTSSVSEVYIKKCGEASTENFKLTHFEMTINIGFLLDIRTHLCFSVITGCRPRDTQQDQIA